MTFLKRKFKDLLNEPPYDYITDQKSSKPRKWHWLSLRPIAPMSMNIYIKSPRIYNNEIIENSRRNGTLDKLFQINKIIKTYKHAVHLLFSLVIFTLLFPKIILRYWLSFDLSLLCFSFVIRNNNHWLSFPLMS